LGYTPLSFIPTTLHRLFIASRSPAASFPTCSLLITFRSPSDPAAFLCPYGALRTFISRIITDPLWLSFRTWHFSMPLIFRAVLSGFRQFFRTILTLGYRHPAFARTHLWFAFLDFLLILLGLHWLHLCIAWFQIIPSVVLETIQPPSP